MPINKTHKIVINLKKEKDYTTIRKLSSFISDEPLFFVLNIIITSTFKNHTSEPRNPP